MKICKVDRLVAQWRGIDGSEYCWALLALYREVIESLGRKTKEFRSNLQGAENWVGGKEW